MNQRRTSMIAVPAATLAVAAVVAATGPAAANGGGAFHVAGSADLAAVQDESITVDDLRRLVAEFEATGEVTFAGVRRLEISLILVEHSINRGTPASAISALEQFKVTASDPRYVPSASARDQLIAAANQFIAQLTTS